jgi:hypothetical protein
MENRIVRVVPWNTCNNIIAYPLSRVGVCSNTPHISSNSPHFPFYFDVTVRSKTCTAKWDSMLKARVTHNCNFGKDVMQAYWNLTRKEEEDITNDAGLRSNLWNQGEHGFPIGNNAVKMLKTARNLHTMRVKNTVGALIYSRHLEKPSSPYVSHLVLFLLQMM